MDTLLKRALARRELEQEEAIVALSPEALRAPHCAGCGVALSMNEDLSDLTRHFCVHCGGRKADAGWDRETKRVGERKAYVLSLLSLGSVPTQDEVPMANEKRSCPECGKTLRSDNKKGVCASCQSKGAKAVDGVAPAPRSSSKGSKGFAHTRKKFRVVSDALGIDGEKLLEQFMSGWLEKIRGSVRAPEEDDVL